MTTQREGTRDGGQGGGGRGRGRGRGGQGQRGGQGRDQQPQQQGGQNRDRAEREESGLEERVVKIRRVSKVVKGGRHLSFNALVVVGDGEGKVGMSMGKSKAVPDAVRKGTAGARKNLKPVTLSGTTIPHEVEVTFNGAKVLLRPAAPGTGIIAGGGVRAVMEVVGVKDVLSKTFGSNNTMNIVHATMNALAQLRDPKAESRRRLGGDSRGQQPSPEQVALAGYTEGNTGGK